MRAKFMAWEDIVKMKDLAEMINVDKDKSLFDGPEKDRLNRFLQDSDLSKNFTLVDYTIALTNLSILAKKPEARISDNLRSKIQIVYKRFNVFSESMFALADDLKKELEDLYDLDRVAQGKMTMRDFDEG